MKDPAATSAGPVFLFETDTSRLWFDADGSTGDLDPVLIVTLARVSALAAADFELLA